MSEKFAVVFLPVSTSAMYVSACKERNLTPIILIPYAPTPIFDEIVELIEESFPGDEVRVCHDADEAMGILEGREIVAVFAGMDPAIGIADELSKRLGLRGNDPSTTWLRTTKLGMETALERAGLRHMRTKVITSEEDIREFWATCDGICVVKYSSSGASVGFKICRSLDECLDHCDLLRGSTNNLGERGVEILMQEFVTGDEYAVNTASFDGKHVITDIWRYSVVHMGGNVMYDSELLPNESFAPKGLTDYALAVLDATGVRYGMCHSEYFLDSKGPVLIETNPRMMGASLTEDFLIEMLGRTYADYSFATLDEESFAEISDVHFDTHGKHAIIEELASSKEGEFDPAPTRILVSSLPSCFSCRMKDGRRQIRRTTDLATGLGYVYLVSESKEGLARDYRMIKELESDYPDLMMEADPFRFAHILADLRSSAESASSGDVLDVEASVTKSIPYGRHGLDAAMSFFGMVECGSDGDKIQFRKE